jgi:hypothetical protein
MSLSTQKLKALQMICGIPMIIALIIYLYMDWKLDYKGIYYDLTKGIFQLLLALTWHFGMSYTKITRPEKYNSTLHIIPLISFILKLF